MPREPIRKEVEGHFHVCKGCKYKGGFHVSFEATQTEKVHRIILMCPNCERTYDIDWKIQTEQD